jgi:glycosyltransferase involved in cell wall biosynthesis
VSRQVSRAAGAEIHAFQLDSFQAEDLPVKLVSVVVLTRDRPAKLRRCVASLLEQDVDTDFEIIIVDDGSHEAARYSNQDLAATDSHIRVLWQENRGIPAARNLGIRAARGEVIAIVADDYVLHQHYLRDGLRYLREHPEAGAIRFRMGPLNRTFGSRVSHCYYDASIAYRLELDRRGNTPFWRKAAHITESGVTDRLEAAGAALFRAGVFDVVGGFDESLQRGEDTEHSARFRRAGFEVHFVAADRVLHDYARWPFDTLRKCLLTGYWREKLPAPEGEAKVSRWRSLARKLFGVSHAFRRAAHAPDTLSYILYLPWLLAFELATLAGHGLAWCQRMFGTGTGSGPSAPDETAGLIRHHPE